MIGLGLFMILGSWDSFAPFALGKSLAALATEEFGSATGVKTSCGLGVIFALSFSDLGLTAGVLITSANGSGGAAAAAKCKGSGPSTAK
jgi:hypothetical protein